MLEFVNLLNSWQVHLSAQVFSCQVQNKFWLVSTVNLLSSLECILIFVVSSLFQYHPKYTSLHLNLNCLKNYRCKNPHLARKESPFPVSRKKQNYACQLRWRLGNWVCQLTKFLRAMCLGPFFLALINCFKLPRSAYVDSVHFLLSSTPFLIIFSGDSTVWNRWGCARFLGILFEELLGELVKVF